MTDETVAGADRVADGAPGRPFAGSNGGPTAGDRFFDALADRRRRAVLRWLAERDGATASVEALADRIAGRTSDPDADRVAVSLYHVHLPKLAEAGLVEFDDRSRTVRYRGGDRVEDCLESVDREDGATRRPGSDE